MNGADDIILCQPDNRKGCSVCCGLFNIRDTAKENLRKFLEEGKGREKLYRVYEEFTEPEEVRDRFSHICPYQGFITSDKPGCLIHPLSSGIEGRDRSLFASSVCGKFLCPAHELLTGDEKSALIKHVDDWYLYSIAIIDPESFSFIYNYGCGICGESGLSSLLNAGLKTHAENLFKYEGILFFYSLPEYRINMERFSLKFREDYKAEVLKAMDKCRAG